jgi:hypothetical protein
MQAKSFTSKSRLFHLLSFWLQYLQNPFILKKNPKNDKKEGFFVDPQHIIWLLGATKFQKMSNF